MYILVHNVHIWHGIGKSKSHCVLLCNSVFCRLIFKSRIRSKVLVGQPQQYWLVIILKYVHAGPPVYWVRNGATDMSVKEQITHDNCAQTDAQLSSVFFLSNPICPHFFSILNV